MTTHWKQKACFTLSTALIFILILAIVLVRISINHREKVGVDFPKKTIIADYEYDNQNFSSNSDWTSTVDISNSYPNLTKFYETVPHEYVKPLKIHNFSLNEADLLYESKRNNTNSDYSAPYSVTGNYRGKTNSIWDPHPEYIINAFGHHLHLVLHQDTSFVSTNIFRVIKILNNQTEEQDDSDHYLGCYYKGFVQGDEESAVAVSLCHGMTGHIKTSFASLLIQPVENSTKDDSSLLHKIWKQSSRQGGHGRESVDIDFNLGQGDTTRMPELSRKKRHYVEEHLYTLEVLVAVDPSMYDFHKDDLKSYIFTLISIVSNIFADASIGNSIKISVTKVIIIKNDILEPIRTNTSSTSQLNNFCSLFNQKKYHYDTAIMLTRNQICRNEKGTVCDTLGMAALGTVCKPYSCSMVQDNGLPAAFTIAHELGHVLSMPHDDDKRCAKFKTGRGNTLNIMSSTMGDNIHPWSWSACSRHYVSEFLEKEDTSCLENSATLNDNVKQQLPGEMYSLDQQCQLIHGPFSQYCDIDSECKRLWCKAPSTDMNCRSSNLPWADGTPCENSNSGCVKGECVAKEGRKPIVVHGEWGPWSAFTRCSMTCGGGIQESQRECDNPLPQNGGKYCSGNRKKYRSCNTQNCPPGTPEFREQQCSRLNGNHFQIKNLSEQVRWVPKYGLKDKCKLYCRVENSSSYFALEDQVEDGTPCTLDSFDKCVNGICRPAGCDNELNSNAQLDKCGVCEGSNETCEDIVGHFYKSDLLANATKSKNDYFYVATIPKGSSNIEIVQPEHNSVTYIALRDDNGKYLLNGERVLQTIKYIVFYAGVTLEYNGYKNTIQRVNSTKSRKTHRDLIVEVISGGFDNDDEGKLLTYSYTIEKPKPKPIYYKWVPSWAPCNSLCQGTSTRTLSCVEMESSLKVATPFCDEIPKPDDLQTLKCNTHCALRLNYTSISECSSECGMIGMREKNLICIQEFFGSESREIDLPYCSTKFNISRFEQCREGCWNYTDWSPCSQTCGTGTQRRNVVCHEDQRIVDDSRCNQRKKSTFKDTIRTCNPSPCIEPFTYYGGSLNYSHYSSWEAGRWGECNDNCEKTRTVICRNRHNCPLEMKPSDRRKCCNVKMVATWSACSVDCGTGTRTREFFCAKVYKPEHKGERRHRVKIDSKYCNNLKVPIPKRPQKSCKTTCKWTSEQWPNCSPNCSSSFITRSVNCSASNGRQISHKYCDPKKKPAIRKMCPYCIHREIKYSNCSCEGYRRRRIECFDVNRKRIACPTRQRVSKERCNDIPDRCYRSSCLDIKQYNNTARDGFYNLLIKQRIVQIYCHNMSTKPKEYIAVNSTKNYSVFYDKSASNRYMYKCPPESQYDEYPTMLQNYHRTHFNKIRLNLHTMEVDQSDFTFAKTNGKQQAFGSAGDCFNKNPNCHQGSFSINLEGTGFRMQPRTKWDTFGQLSSIKYINSLKPPYTSIRAFCGGYCGGCYVSKSTRLILDFYNG